MYRKSMEVVNEQQAVGSEFVNRLTELPISQLAMLQLTSLYNRAKEQSVLGSGIRVGEGTLSLAAKMASPVVSRLPMSSIDNMAVRQLQMLEDYIPAIKKDPKLLMERSGEMVNTALAPAFNTVNAVRDLGYSTVSQVKTYAVETSSPTVDRVHKATTYGKQTVDNVKAGAATTYESVKNLTYDGVKTNLGSTYTTVRGLSIDDVRSGVANGRQGLVTGVRASVDGVKSEVNAYASETLKPTVARYTAARQYTVEKVNDTYDGVKGAGNRLVDRVNENTVVKAVSGTYAGFLGVSENALDKYLPAVFLEDVDDDENSAGNVHPASAEAGSWNRSMVLISNFRGRLYATSRRNYVSYSTRASDMGHSVRARYHGSIDYARSTYTNSHEYVSASYASLQKRLEGPRNYIASTYNSATERLEPVRERVYVVYNSVSKRFDPVRERVYHVYNGVTKRLEPVRERFYYAYNSVSERFEPVRQRFDYAYNYVTKRYEQTRERVVGVYTRATERYTNTKQRIADTYNATTQRISDARNRVSYAYTSVKQRVVFISVRVHSTAIRRYGVLAKRYPALDKRVTDANAYVMARYRPIADRTNVVVTYVTETTGGAYQRVRSVTVAVYDTCSASVRRVTAVYGYGYEMTAFIVTEAKETVPLKYLLPSAWSAKPATSPPTTPTQSGSSPEPLAESTPKKSDSSPDTTPPTRKSKKHGKSKSPSPKASKPENQPETQPENQLENRPQFTI